MKLKVVFLGVLFLGGILVGIMIGYLNVFRQSTPSLTTTEESIKRSVSKLASDENFQPSVPSLNQIFAQDHSWVATLSAEKVRTLIATGDVIPARSVNYRAVTSSNFLWPYEAVADILKNADITFINLESPFVKNCPLTNEGMVFCSDERNIEGLKYAGVDVVSLANNHAGNWGVTGIKNTVELLASADILATGTSSAQFQDVRRLRFAFLGYNDIDHQEAGISWAQEDLINAQVRNAKQKADIVVVAFHWGVEYTSQPTKRQRQLAHLAIDSGADLVIGNHSHFLQPVEVHQGKHIIYAHGNLIFDQMWSEKTRIGVIGKYIFYDNNLVDIEFIPIKIYDYGQPRLVLGEKKRKILDEMRSESERLITAF